MVQLELKTEVRGLFLKDPERAAKIFADEWKNFLNESSSFTLRKAVTGTPVWRGNLASSEFRELRGNGLDMFAIVATPAINAGLIERGTPAFFPSPIALADWVRGKLGITDPAQIDRVTFLIARNMSKRGVKAHWMFRNAERALRNKAQNMLDQAGNRIIARWNKP